MKLRYETRSEDLCRISPLTRISTKYRKKSILARFRERNDIISGFFVRVFRWLMEKWRNGSLPSYYDTQNAC